MKPEVVAARNYTPMHPKNTVGPTLEKVCFPTYLSGYFDPIFTAKKDVLFLCLSLEDSFRSAIFSDQTTL